MQRPITVVTHDARWSDLFQEEANGLGAILGQEVVAIHHIGSTAIPGIYAKPIIDILVEVQDIERIDTFNRDMIERGYVPKGEFGIRGRRFFIKGTEESRTHHVHVFQTGNPEFERHLEFRDYLRAHPEEAQAYSRLKQELARRFPHDIDSYTAGKDDLINKLERKAKAWKNRGQKADNC
ncbi:MAG: GrpB family protein [Anaerolineae bacterium]|jgi:GrpB-like predicted nucleotidyltransferase (UPF0157 family)